MKNLITIIFVLSFMIFANGLMAQITNNNGTAGEKESADINLPVDEDNSNEVDRGPVGIMIADDPKPFEESEPETEEPENADENNEILDTIKED